MIEPTSTLRFIVAYQATKDGPFKFATNGGQVIVFRTPAPAVQLAQVMEDQGAFAAVMVPRTIEEIEGLRS